MSIELKFESAYALDQRGRDDEAKLAYLEILKENPRHYSTLIALGNLLFRSYYRTAARTTYAQAIAVEPGNPVAHLNMAHALVEHGDLDVALQEYETVLRLSPENQDAHLGIANILERRHDLAGAHRHRVIAFKDRSVQFTQYRGEALPVTVLLLAVAGLGNIETAQLLDPAVFLCAHIVSDYHSDDQPLPGAEVIFNIIGEADARAAELAHAARMIQTTTLPVLNHPHTVLRTGRIEVSNRLRGIAGVRTPLILEAPTSALQAQDAGDKLRDYGFAFPLLLRAPGFHTGEHFERVDQPNELAAAAARMPSERTFVIELLDARGSDGRYRKYRAMFVDGRVYPLHLAISDQWKVHYFTAAMADDRAFREEEHRYLYDIRGALGERALLALHHIAGVLQLDYGGIDFGLDEHGNVLVFEANATMVVSRPPTNEPLWNYRRPAIEAVIDGVKRMVLDRAGRSHPEIPSPR